ncbi:hypothetical protein ACI65C_006754 [Semiaphis heraclei]
MNALSDQCHSVKLKELTSSDGVSDDETMFSCSSNNFKEKSMFYVDFEKIYRTVYDTCQITDNCELLPNNEYYCESFAKRFLNLYLPFTYMWTRLMMPQEIMSKYSVKTITNGNVEKHFDIVKNSMMKGETNMKLGHFVNKIQIYTEAVCKEIKEKIPRRNKKCKKSSSEWDDSQNCCPGDPGNILIEEQWQKRSKTVQSHFSHTNIQRLSYDWQYKSSEKVVQYDFDKNGQDKVSNLPRYSNHLFADINYYSPNLSEQYVVGMYSSEGYKDVTLYDEDFRTLLNNSWLNGAVIDALLLIYVTNEIGYIPVKVSNSIWSSTKVQIAKFDWTKYCVLFLPINPEDVNVATDRKLLKPAVCRNLGDTFLLQTDYNNANNLKNYLVEWVNKSDPSYGLSDDDYPSYDVDDVTNEKHYYEGNVTSYAYNNSKKETCITLNNINYTLEFSNDTQNYNQITVENNNFNDQDNVFNIIENTKQVNHDDIYGKSSVILGTPVSSVENPTPMEQDNDDINVEQSLVLGTSVSSLDSLTPMEQDNDDINGEPCVVLGTPVSSLDSLTPMEQNNDDINGEPSVILGTAESLVGSLEVHLNTNNQNKRKSRIVEPKRCKSKIEDDLREQLYNMYWAMGSFNRRTSYMSKLITCCPKKCFRKRRDTPEKQKPKEKTYKYYVPKDGNLIQVCKGCFMRIFCESTKFLRNICTNMLTSPAQRCSPDKRGCAPPGNKRCQDSINLLINHINLLPSYESHYCRKETSKKYLPSHFTLQRAYDEYKISVEKPVNRTLYEKYFKAAGLKVKNPKEDTCAQCDKKNATSMEIKRAYHDLLCITEEKKRT